MSILRLILWRKGKQYQLFEKAYRQYAQGRFRFIYFKVSDYELAKDFTTDTFIRFWKQLVNGKKIQNDKALLYFIAKGITIDYYRKKNNTKRVSLDTIDERLLGVIDPAEDKFSIKQELEQVYIKLKKIKKEYQDVILLHYVEDLKISEIADVLNKKGNTVRVLLHRALKSLKEKL